MMPVFSVIEQTPPTEAKMSSLPRWFNVYVPKFLCCPELSLRFVPL